MISTKKGVLLVNLGTPNSPSRKDVYVYLKQFLLDPRVIDIGWLPRNLLVRGIIAPFRSGDSAKLYKKLWTPEGSPIKVYGEQLKIGVQKILGEDYQVELAMRYQNPSIESALENLFKNDINDILIFPLFPQYASASTGSVHEEVMRIVSKQQNIPDIKFINSYCDNEDMAKIFADNARKYDIDSYDHILFSYHGLPKRQIRKGDPYDYCFKENCCNTLTKKNQFCYCAQCTATTQAIAKELNLKPDQYTQCYQSRLGSDPWIQPYTSDILKERSEKGDKKLLVFCPAFVADCLETTIEVSEEYMEEFEEMGGEHVQLVESLNDNPKWFELVANMVRSHI